MCMRDYIRQPHKRNC
uniref:Uncharacterized protein n=1 Tax=Arundo donax TaxID=35708 RepID=A0A0A9AQ57_ARUDO